MAIKFCVKAGKSAVEMIKLINMAYGSAAMSRAILHRWYGRFRDGREVVKNNARSGCPSTARTDENVESVHRLLTEDHCTTLQMIADHLNTGKETVRQIVTEDLGKRKICARFVPHALTTEQQKFLANRNIAALHHPPYSPDLAPADYFLFPKLKFSLNGRHCQTVEEIQCAVARELNNISKTAFLEEMKKLKECANKCTDLGGMYFEE